MPGQLPWNRRQGTTWAPVRWLTKSTLQGNGACNRHGLSSKSRTTRDDRSWACLLQATHASPAKPQQRQLLTNPIMPGMLPGCPTSRAGCLQDEMAALWPVCISVATQALCPGGCHATASRAPAWHLSGRCHRATCMATGHAAGRRCQAKFTQQNTTSAIFACEPHLKHDRSWTCLLQATRASPAKPQQRQSLTILLMPGTLPGCPM